MRPELAPKSTWVRGGITWLVYWAFGALGVLLASPQAGVQPLFISAGVGLAFVLGWGTAMVWAVGLGSASVLVMTNWSTHGQLHLGALMGAAAVTFFGAAAQAWVGARWCQHSRDPELCLEHPSHILRFLLIAGPLACLINAAVTVPAMALLGLLPTSQIPQAAVSWWVGDTLGVLVGAPMMLTLVGKPADLWRARRLVVGLPLLVTTLLLGAAIYQVQKWQDERANAVFNKDAAALSSSVKLRLTGYLDSLEALRILYAASDDVTRQEFHLATEYWLRTVPGIQAMGWHERVAQAGIPAFEAQQAAEGIDVHVHDRGGRPTSEPEAVVMRFVEPMEGNAVALGTNILSIPVAREAYERAVQEDRAAASQGFTLTQEVNGQIGVVLYRAVYHGEPYTPRARHQASRGAVFVALRMGNAIHAMMQGHPAYLRACLIDASSSPPVALDTDGGCSRPGAAPLHRALMPIDFAGRSWHLVIWAHDRVPLIGQIGSDWILSIGGVLLAAALGTLLLVITGHKRRIEMAMKIAEEQRARAEASNRAKSEFLSRMSHELRTPLNAVLGFAQVMDMDREAPLPPAQHQRLQQIQHAGWHLLDMIDDVLDLSRIDAGTLKLNTELGVPLDAARAAIDAVKDLAKQHQVTIVDVENAPMGWGVRADASRLRQILVNLLSNAIKYNHAGGLVKLSMHIVNEPGQDDRIQIAVQDTGMGMSADQMSHLFQPFNRLGRERVAPDGAGIGLVISRHLAQLMGGQLEAHSEEGQGSTFTLTLPAAKMVAVRPVPMVMPVAPLTPQGHPAMRHILYVEDNKANSDVIRSALASRTWIQLSVAPTIEAGLGVLHDRLQGPPPDLVLLDVHLPDASGLEFLHLMKANPQTASIPVIMISADAMPEQVDAALAAGACCYLTKPVQIPALLAQVDELLAV